MFLNYAHRVIEDCQDHIKSNPDLNPAIEVYLAAYANLQLCADIQRQLVELFSNGLAAKCQGTVATEFILSACKSRVRNATYQQYARHVQTFRFTATTGVPTDCT